LLRQTRRIDAPGSGDVLAVRVHLDQPVTGELVGLLPVLAAALSVSLSGEAAVAGTGIPDLPEREREVDEREDGIDALALLLRPAAGEEHRRTGREPPRGQPQRRLGNAGELFDARRVVLQDRAADGVEPGGPLADETLVEESFFERDEQEAVGEGE